ncbi:MAG: hypothetical protein JW751_29365 [Polyangiaceae bacterium]|nr:hypothetical protein [Polyangiaceae bacterium]
MRRGWRHAAMPVALALACATAPPPQPEPPVAAKAAAAPLRPRLRFSLLDAEGQPSEAPLQAPKDRTLRVEARRADGSLRWWLEFTRVLALRDDGHDALWIVGVRPGRDKLELLRIDATGKGQGQPLPAGNWHLGGPLDQAGAMVVADPETGAVWTMRTAREKLGTLQLHPTHDRRLHVTSRGLLLLAGNDGTLRILRANGETAWDGAIAAPPGDVSFQAPAQPKLTLLPSGAAWLLAPDRRLVAHGPDGSRRFTLGTRARIERLWPLHDGAVLATTRDCQVFRVDESGAIAWRQRVAPEEAGDCTWQNGFVVEGEHGDLGIRAAASGTSDRVWLLGADGTPRWTTAARGAWYARLVAADADTVAVRENDRSWTLRAEAAATEPDRTPRPRPARFERVLTERIDSGLVLPDGHALAQAGERIWEWRGAEWRGGEPVARRLAPSATRSQQLTRFVPGRLALGPNGEAWLSGQRYSTGELPSPPLPTALRRRGAVWVEDAGLRASFAVRAFEDLGSEAGPQLRIASSPTASIVCGAQHCRLPSGAVLELGETTVAIVGRIGGEPWVLTDQALARLEGSQLVVRAEAAPLASPVAIWGATDADFWALGPAIAHHVAGQGWTRMASPVGAPTAIWGPTTANVWLAGELGVAHWDGSAWTRVIGLHGPVRDVFGVAGHVWFATGDGLWEFTRWATLPAGEPPAPPPVATATEPLRLDPRRGPPAAYALRTATFPIDGAAPLVSALEVATTPDGTAWFHDGARVVQLRGAAATVLSSTASAHGHTRLAPVGADRGWWLDELGVVRVEGPNRTRSALRLPELTAIAAAAPDRLWAVGASDDDRLPHAFSLRGDDGEYAPDLPPAAYAAIAAGDTSELWLVGGLDLTHNGAQAWPAGEGIVVHRSRSGVVWHRVPDGPLLAVAAAGKDEAWAVGAAGLLVHLRGGRLTARRLASGRWLRDVAVGPGGELWIVGDDGTLLHGNGAALDAVTGLPLPPRPQLVSVAARGQGRAWIASPDGILDVTARRPPSPQRARDADAL